MNLALVTWRDAHADTSAGWTTLADGAANDDGDYIVWSVGWLLTMDDGTHAKHGHVSVAQSLGDVGSECQSIDSVLHIPVENVLAIRVLVDFAAPTLSD